MSTEYGRYKRDAKPAESSKHLLRKRTPQPLSARELARAKQTKTDWETYMGNTPAKDLVKDLHTAGLIDGWRDVTVIVDEKTRETI